MIGMTSAKRDRKEFNEARTLDKYDPSERPVIAKNGPMLIISSVALAAWIAVLFFCALVS